MSARRAPLDVRVRLLADPCLWCWDIVDESRAPNHVVRSSWASEWAAYDTEAEAVAAGRARLSELWAAREGDARGDDRRRGANAA